MRGKARSRLDDPAFRRRSHGYPRVVRFGGLFFLLYLVIGVLVAAGVIGNDDYFAGTNSAEEIAEAVLAVMLWPLVLLGVEMNLGSGGDSSGGDGGGAEKPEGGGGKPGGGGK